MQILSATDIAQLSKDHLFKKGFEFLTEDLKRWQDFHKTPRHATHYPHGVIELMPCADSRYYSFKYVNGHPGNPELGKSSIVGTGLLADVETGYPLMFCDMTILTAVRTAVGSMIAASHLAKKDSSVFGFIGTGAQSEFQTYAFKQIFDIKQLRFYDRDPEAMAKYQKNIEAQGWDVELVPCASAEEVVDTPELDVLTTCICEKEHVVLFPYEMVKDHPHLYINGIGGDCPGKTELDPELTRNARVVLEFYEQSKEEGEIQNLPEEEHKYDELWEVVQGKKPGRTEDDQIILFDAVGFGLADYSIMRMIYEEGLGREEIILPHLEDPKNLFGFVGVPQPVNVESLERAMNRVEVER